MAKILCLRSCFMKYGNMPFVNQSRNTNDTVIPVTELISENCDKINMDPVSDKLRNLRIAVTPSYGKGIDTYVDSYGSMCPNSTLAGNPRRLTAVQNIREEILEKWNRRPTTNIQKEWLRYIVFN